MIRLDNMGRFRYRYNKIKLSADDVNSSDEGILINSNKLNSNLKKKPGCINCIWEAN